MSLKILGLVPARSGSKGVPGKNIKLLGKKSLIAHTLETAEEAGCLDRLIVSTDDEAIADVARRYGAQVPWLRPPELATDTASVVDVIRHALERLSSDEEYRPDAVMLLQPTSPFRSVASIRAAVEIYQKFLGESVVAVSPARDHPYWCKAIGEDGSLQDWDPEVRVPVNRQELPPAYRLNGILYLASVSTLMNRGSLYSSRTRPLVVSDEEEALDINTQWDWKLTEYLWALRHRCGDR